MTKKNAARFDSLDIDAATRARLTEFANGFIMGMLSAGKKNDLEDIWQEYVEPGWPRQARYDVNVYCDGSTYRCAVYFIAQEPKPRTTLTGNYTYLHPAMLAVLNKKGRKRGKV